jgi:uncharacterized Zn-binding protein involved in type VI secretion
LSSPIARKGDPDNLGHTIVGDVSTDVTINGLPAALQGSTMDDGAAINGAVSATVKINGKPVAKVGSTTTPHPNDPGKSQSGSISSGSPNVTVG